MCPYTPFLLNRWVKDVHTLFKFEQAEYRLEEDLEFSSHCILSK